jgi:hypothetical protein
VEDTWERMGEKAPSKAFATVSLRAEGLTAEEEEEEEEEKAVVVTPVTTSAASARTREEIRGGGYWPLSRHWVSEVTRAEVAGAVAVVEELVELAVGGEMAVGRR